MIGPNRDPLSSPAVARSCDSNNDVVLNCIQIRILAEIPKPEATSAAITVTNGGADASTISPTQILAVADAETSVVIHSSQHRVHQSAPPLHHPRSAVSPPAIRSVPSRAAVRRAVPVAGVSRAPVQDIRWVNGCQDGGGGVVVNNDERTEENKQRSCCHNWKELDGWIIPPTTSPGGSITKLRQAGIQ